MTAWENYTDEDKALCVFVNAPEGFVRQVAFARLTPSELAEIAAYEAAREAAYEAWV